jgi:UDP-GlcNAc:undecaprenyl-phosphate GlcNAc-1-phosphate transferase
MTGVLAALFAGAFAATLGLTPLMIRLARRVQFLDQPGPRKIHAEPVPYGGGLVVATVVLVGTFIARRLILHAGPPVQIKSFAWPVFAMGSLVILALGVVDDRRRLPARFKLLVQTLVAVGVSLGGARLQLFDAPPVVSVAVTTIWILAVTNSFNLLDHMDGLSGGVALLAGAAFLIVAIQTEQVLIAAMIVPLLGACLGFLCFNFPPAKIFTRPAIPSIPILSLSPSSPSRSSTRPSWSSSASSTAARSSRATRITSRTASRPWGCPVKLLCSSSMR